MPERIPEWHDLADQVEVSRIEVLFLVHRFDQAIFTFNRCVLGLGIDSLDIFWPDLVVLAAHFLHRLSVLRRFQILEIFVELLRSPLDILGVLVYFLFGRGWQSTCFDGSLGDYKRH